MIPTPLVRARERKLAPRAETLSFPQVVPVAVVPGEGAGPEIMHAVLGVLEAAGARLQVASPDLRVPDWPGSHPSLPVSEMQEVLGRASVLLMVPPAAVVGGGGALLRALRRELGLYVTLRPCTSYHPCIDAPHPSLDVVIVSGTEEDVSAPSTGVPGAERVIRHAFEYARRQGRSKVTCVAEEGGSRLPDGLLDQLGGEYAELEREHLTQGELVACLLDEPTRLDVVVVRGRGGDLVTEVAARLAGPVGMAPSASVGDCLAVFGPGHGPLPRLSTRGTANPSGLLLAAVMLLVHVGQAEAAQRIHDAWLRTLEDGVRTGDMTARFPRGPAVGTERFAKEVIDRLGQTPSLLRRPEYTRVARGGRAPASC